jgi:hypothetical protein
MGDDLRIDLVSFGKYADGLRVPSDDDGVFETNRQAGPIASLASR